MYKRGDDVVALYTCTDGKFRNAQCEAIADDASLSSFTRSPDNPIIRTPPEGVAPYYFRDPTEPFHWKGRDYTFIGATDAQGPRGVVLAYSMDMSSGATSTTRRPFNIVWAGATGRGALPSCWSAPASSTRASDAPCSSTSTQAPTSSTRAAPTILKLSLGAALRKDVVLIGAVQHLGQLHPTVAGSRGPTFIANEHRTQHRCGGRVATGAVVLDCGSAYASKSFTDQQGPENLVELAARLRRACHAANFSVQRHADAA